MPDSALDTQASSATHDSGCVELISRILRSRFTSARADRVARSLLESVDGLEGLSRASRADLLRVNGIGPVLADSLLAGIELGRLVVARPLVRGVSLRSPFDVERHCHPLLRDLLVEQFHVLCLDARHRLISRSMVSSGTLTASLVHPREVFRHAVARAAAAVILVHNHPSGDPSPSREDCEVTARLCSAGRLVGIRVVDHVIVAAGGHYSFREAGGIGEVETPPCEPQKQ